MGELLVALAVFTVWQGLLPPVNGRVAFLAPFGRVHVRRGARWTLLPLWPLAPGFVSAERPLEIGEHGVRARFPRPGEWDGDTTFSELEEAGHRGRAVRAGGRVLCRCLSRGHAQRVTELLRRLAVSEPEARAGALAALARLALDGEAPAEIWTRSARSLGWLGRLSASSLVVAVGVGVAAILPELEERLLLAGLLPLGLLQIATAAALFVAHRAVAPEDASGRLEAVFSALLFPPAAWTAAQHLRCELASRCHPARAAAALLEGEALLDLLRTELALLERSLAGAPADGVERRLLAEERRALVDLAAAHGFSPQALGRPRARRDRNAASYCVICGSDYRAGFDWCRDCRVATLTYAAPSSGVTEP